MGARDCVNGDPSLKMLKPCAHCGGEAFFEEFNCVRCGAECGALLVAETQAGAIAAWNRREARVTCPLVDTPDECDPIQEPHHNQLQPLTQDDLEQAVAALSQGV